ncbi:hypothetical protein Tco_0018344 [Tanacetum coccineum]
MLKIKVYEIGGKEEIFTSEAWRRAFDINEPIYTELCHEFYATYEFDEVVTDEELITKKLIKFRLGGRETSTTSDWFLVFDKTQFFDDDILVDGLLTLLTPFSYVEVKKLLLACVCTSCLSTVLILYIPSAMTLVLTPCFFLLVEVCKVTLVLPTKSLFDVGSTRISIFIVNTLVSLGCSGKYHKDIA